jgi:hypothetical protein
MTPFKLSLIFKVKQRLMFKNLRIGFTCGLLFTVMIHLAGCNPSPQNFVAVPASDNTPPTTGITINDGILNRDFNEKSQPTTLKVSSNVTILAGATDNDGGIKSVELWATYTRSKPGQTQNPGLAGAPIKSDISTAKVGESTLKNRFFSYSLDMKKELGSWSNIKVDLWVVGENFHGGKTQTPSISLTYP